MGNTMSSPIPHRVWHVIYSRCVLVLTAMTLSIIGVAAQPARTTTAQPEAATSPAAALAYLSTVSGGFNNTASGVAASINGGFGNTASGYFATVGGGFGNLAAGTGSFVAGSNALNDTPAHIGVFLFADNSGYQFYSAAANEFAARATGGVRFVLGVDRSGTPTWSCAASNGNSWACSSDRNLKENVKPVDVAGVLRRVAELPLYQWNARGTDPNVKHLGPTAQDFMAAFGLGSSDKMIGMQDADGVALAAIQGLNRRLEEQRQSLDVQQQRIVELEDRVSQLDALRSEIAVLKQALTALQKDSLIPVAQH
jgi:trimeric autotransporter adhesin